MSLFLVQLYDSWCLITDLGIQIRAAHSKGSTFAFFSRSCWQRAYVARSVSFFRASTTRILEILWIVTIIFLKHYFVLIL